MLPYLDIPFQHASPKILRAMKRPANEARVLERIHQWRDVCPDIAIRSSFVVGFPGETEEDFQYLLDWLDEARLDRVGAFRFEPVEGAAANALPDPVPEEVKEERYARIMELTARISAEKLAAKVGRTIDVLIDIGRRGRRHRPLEGRRARDRRRGPPARCRPPSAGRHRPRPDRGRRRARPVRGAARRLARFMLCACRRGIALGGCHAIDQNSRCCSGPFHVPRCYHSGAGSVRRRAPVHDRADRRGRSQCGRGAPAATPTAREPRRLPSIPGRNGSATSSTVANIAAPMRGHIHRGVAGTNGGIVVTFFEADSVTLNDCVATTRALAWKSSRTRSDYTSTSTTPTSRPARCAASWPNRVKRRAPVLAGARRATSPDTAPPPPPYSRA